MDFKSFREPSHTPNELALARASTQARVPRVVQAPTKTPKTLEPVARTALWREFYAKALHEGQAEPEKFADSAVRMREQTLKKRAGRHHTVVLKDPPKPPVEMGMAKSRAVPKTPGPRCQAKTLEGRQCGFAATCGSFCKKHAPKETFRLVSDPKRFIGVRLMGFLNASPATVTAVLGKANGVADSVILKEWRLVFADGAPASVFFKTGEDPALHVCGEDIAVMGRVRQLLAL